MKQIRFFFFCTGLGLLFGAWSVSSVHSQTIDSVVQNHPEAYGFRLGVADRIGNTQVSPAIDGYYEVPAGRGLLSYDVLAAFRNFSTLDFPIGSDRTDFVLESYGFHGNLRYVLGDNLKVRPFVGVGVGFDVYQDTGRGHVSASFPIQLGALVDLGHSTDLEIAARAMPLAYVGQNLGFSYGLTAGIRWSPNGSVVGERPDLALAFQRSQSNSAIQLGPTTDWGRVGIVTGSLAAAVTALHIYQLNAWWANQRGPFHVIEDADYQHDFDKAGHMFGGYYTSYFFDQAYRWAGIDTVESNLLGAFSGALYELYVELEDGFAQGWGFSRGDAKSDIAGAAFYLLNQRVPFFKYFKYKWSYFPSDKYLNNQPDAMGEKLTFIEDYTGQSYWMSADVHSMMKDAGLNPWWPKWLNLAVGLSGTGLGPIDTRPGHDIYDLHFLTWLVSLDYDFSKIIPESSSGIWNFVRHSLDYWHFPAPAYEISPEHRFFILFPFKMTIG